MLLTVYCVRRDLSEVTFSLQVDADFELHNFRALCELESGIPAAESQIVYAERPLTDNHRSLASYGLKDGDVVILRQKENAESRPSVQFPSLPRIDFSSIAVPGTSGSRPHQQPAQPPRTSPADTASSPQGLDNPALLRDMLLANPHELSLLKERNPPLAEALLSGDLEKFTKVLIEQQQDRARREQERIRLFAADPFDLEAQAKIEEDIRQQNIEENMTIAMEEAPESFGQVVMLYINCKVNGHPVKAFVDSGAQMTIMSQACAERCNIMRLVDRRWAGIAKGVGTQKIIGRVHLAQVQIEGDFLPCSFSILEEQPMDMLLGLDMLKRHQCSIDLKKNVLVIGTTGTQTTFLPEGELPECARLAYGSGRDDIRPEEIADQELAEALQKSVEDAEKSDKETTSLGTSSLPACGGSDSEAHSSGLSSKISHPVSLDCSVSAPASICSYKPSPREITDPSAVRAESQGASDKNERSPPFPDLPAEASSHSTMEDQPAGCLRSATTLWDSSKETIMMDNLKKSPAQESIKAHPDREQKDLPVLATQVPPPQTFLGKKGPRSPCQDPSPETGPQQHTQPANEQPEVEQWTEADSPRLPWITEMRPSLPPTPLKSVGLQAEDQGDEQQKPGPPPPEDTVPSSASFGSSCTETIMEVDVIQQSQQRALCSLAGSQNAGASDLTADNPWVKVEASLHHPSNVALGNPVATIDLQPPENNVEMSETNSESLYLLRETHPSLSLSADEQASTNPAGPTEESCLSVTAALKELHQLLVISCQESPGNLVSEEVVCPQEMAAEARPDRRQIAEKSSLSQHLSTSSRLEQNSQGSSCEVKSVLVKAKRSARGESGISGNLDESLAAAPGAGHKSQEMGRESSSFPGTSVETPGHLNSGGPDVSPEYVATEGGPILPTSQQTEASPSAFIPLGLSQDPHDLVTGMPEIRGNVICPEATRPLHGLEQLDRPLASIPSLLPSHLFPAADVDRILRAGFTLREALGALQRVGGNADLALLILLAKNIIVPT
ncbi:protein DDI1 homolog 2 isoform X1 [Monodelphis domestica]|uniref:protein DDI1 homolog 2 isoform X1 n=2 Tax=Monodelphis domestica TaxID=13616 RepID=UPI0024E1B4B8|nr:protein DDI1 homolog 2 isoform X1 [Monodelphis domestica]